MLKLNLGCGGFPLKGFVNMDSRGDIGNVIESRDPGEYIVVPEWKWQNGLIGFSDGVVDAITESHSLMYLLVEEYEAVFREIHRVLKNGGIFRITEDNCERPEEELKRDGLPWGNPASAVGPIEMEKELKKVFSFVENVDFGMKTNFKDSSLIQQFHGTPPRVFHIEAIK